MNQTNSKFQLVLLMLILMFSSVKAFGQNRCLSKAEAAGAINLFKNSRNEKLNKSLQKELLKMQKNQQKLVNEIIVKFDDNQSIILERDKTGEENLLRLCGIVKQNGWLTNSVVGSEGILAAMYIILQSRNADLQKEIFPVVFEAVKKGQIDKSFLATMIDNYRVNSGLPQYFGTRFEIEDEIIHIAPLWDEQKIEKWRKLYNLPPFSKAIKELEIANGLPVVKDRISSALKKSAQNTQKVAEINNPEFDALPNLETETEDEIIVIDSTLVNINVRINSTNAEGLENLSLDKTDFKVFADGIEQNVEFFLAAKTPFDLILLLDLSGATSGKQDEIRRSTKKFIEAARPQDRIAIVTFTDEINIVSELTTDKKMLLKKAGKIGMTGGSKVWDALDFVFQEIVDKESRSRRSAIVFMTDGVDQTLGSNYRFKPDNGISKISFADLLENIRSHDTTIYPIYFDTETRFGLITERAYRNARRTLKLIAEESGGEMFSVKKAKDLEGTYDEIIQDLSKIYSLGYLTDTIPADGFWHVLKVELPAYPKLKIITRKGFYSR